MNDSTAPRAPRLTANRLADLAIGIEVYQAEIDYLEGCLTQYAAGTPLHTRFKAKREALERARDWTQGKITAEVARREAAPAAERADVRQAPVTTGCTTDGFCDVCDATLTAGEVSASPRHGQDLCDGCAVGYDEANPVEGMKLPQIAMPMAVVPLLDGAGA